MIAKIIIEDDESAIVIFTAVTNLKIFGGEFATNGNWVNVDFKFGENVFKTSILIGEVCHFITVIFSCAFSVL